MNLILFGPPGIGKSTIIGALKSAGCRAVDLEDLHPSQVRFSIPSQVDNVVLGGADLNPKRKYSKAFKVFLSMPQSEYEKRRAARDAQVPGKSEQASHRVEDWMRGVKYDYIIDVSRPIKDVVQEISSIMNKINNKEGGGHENS